MIRSSRLMLVLLGPVALATSSWGQPEFIDSKPRLRAFDPIVVPTPMEFGDDKVHLGYWRRLHGVIAPYDDWKLPLEITPEVLAIDSAVGAGGLRFGMTTDDVVELWGLPTSVKMRFAFEAELVMNYEVNRLGFNENALCTISIGSHAFPRASFRNGVGFDSSPEDALAAFGPPYDELTIEGGSRVLYFRDGATRVRFQFVSGVENRSRLIAIELTKCREH